MIRDEIASMAKGHAPKVSVARMLERLQEMQGALDARPAPGFRELRSAHSLL